MFAYPHRFNPASRTDVCAFGPAVHQESSAKRNDYESLALTKVNPLELI